MPRCTVILPQLDLLAPIEFQSVSKSVHSELIRLFDIAIKTPPYD